MSHLVVPRKILDQHVAVLGKTRSGKSSVLRGLVEDLLDREEPTCIVDPKGDWWGIKLARDGKRPGYPVVIFGGDHADVPINEHAGAHVAELFATGNRPCLIDLGGWTVADRTKFWVEFASTLFKHTKGKRYLVVDEVHNFAPKGSLKGTEGQMSKALHWTNRLASEGLGKGIVMLFASQRPQKVHNDTLTSAETLIAMRVLHPSDRSAVSDWIKGCGDSEGSEVLGSLAQMARGEGWVWSPEIGFGPKRVKFPMFRTYDSFRPQTVEDTKNLKGWAEVDLDEVRKKLDVFIEEAKENDPALLKQQITDLRRQIMTLEKAKPAAAAPPTKVPSIDPAALHHAQRALTVLTDIKKLAASVVAASAGLSDAIVGIEEAPLSGVQPRLRNALAYLRRESEAAGTLDNAATTAHDEVHAIAEVLRASKIQVKIAAVGPDTALKEAGKRIAASIPRGGPTYGDSTLKTMHRNMLTALAQRGKPLTKKQIRAFTGYTDSGPVSTAFADLAREGFMEPVEGTNTFQITRAGVAALGPYERLPTGKALRDYVLAKCSKMEREMLTLLFNAYPYEMTKKEIREQAGYTDSGPVSTAFARLVSQEWATSPAKGKLRAAEAFFED